jgi:hypothetical protein
LGDDPAAWRAWWTDEAKGVLPESFEPEEGPLEEPTEEPRGDEPG